MAICKTCQEIVIEQCDDILCDIVLPTSCITNAQGIECLGILPNTSLSEILSIMGTAVCGGEINLNVRNGLNIDNNSFVELGGEIIRETIITGIEENLKIELSNNGVDVFSNFISEGDVNVSIGINQDLTSTNSSLNISDSTDFNLKTENTGISVNSNFNSKLVGIEGTSEYAQSDDFYLQIYNKSLEDEILIEDSSIIFNINDILIKNERFDSLGASLTKSLISVEDSKIRLSHDRFSSGDNAFIDIALDVTIKSDNDIKLEGLDTYVDDAAAGVGGLSTNSLYKLDLTGLGINARIIAIKD